jgi:hypothetical protein
MRAYAEIGLSVRQPWAELILAGVKTIEVRTWKTSHRGRLWIHAGKAIDSNACTAYELKPDALVVGSIAGTVEVSDCFAFTEQTWRSLYSSHLNLVPFDPRFFGWILRNPRRTSPIPYRGTLGLMKIPTETLRG